MCGPLASLTDGYNNQTKEKILGNLSKTVEVFLGNIDIPFHSIEISAYDRSGILVYVYATHSQWTKTLVASFTLLDMPSCPYIGISTSTYVTGDFKNKGISTLLQIMKKYICKQVGIKKLIATVNKDNKFEKASLIQNGWNEVDTVGEVGLWTISYENIVVAMVE
jgi:hypothetical protein